MVDTVADIDVGVVIVGVRVAAVVYDFVRLVMVLLLVLLILRRCFCCCCCMLRVLWVMLFVDVVNVADFVVGVVEAVDVVVVGVGAVDVVVVFRLMLLMRL